MASCWAGLVLFCMLISDHMFLSLYACTLLAWCCTALCTLIVVAEPSKKHSRRWIGWLLELAFNKEEEICVMASINFQANRMKPRSIAGSENRVAGIQKYTDLPIKLAKKNSTENVKLD